MSSVPWTLGTWAKLALSVVGCVWVIRATEHPGPQREGEGLQQLLYMALAVAAAFGVTELLALAIGSLGRDWLGLGASPALERLRQRLGPGGVRTAVLALVAGVLLAKGAWYAYYRATRPLEGFEWRVLTSGGPFRVAVEVPFDVALRGCPSLGPGFQLATRIELETRAAELRRHGRGARFWVRDPASTDGAPATLFDPGRAASPVEAAVAHENHLALCVQEAQPTGAPPPGDAAAVPR